MRQNHEVKITSSPIGDLNAKDPTGLYSLFWEHIAWLMGSENDLQDTNSLAVFIVALKRIGTCWSAIVHLVKMKSGRSLTNEECEDIYNRFFHDLIRDTLFANGEKGAVNEHAD